MAERYVILKPGLKMYFEGGLFPFYGCRTRYRLSVRTRQKQKAAQGRTGEQFLKGIKSEFVSFQDDF